jgi:hypothetical protein
VSLSFSRASLLRGAAVVAITASVTLAAACSDEDVVDTIPPPRPNHTRTSDGPMVSIPSSISTAPPPATTRRSTSTSRPS